MNVLWSGVALKKKMTGRTASALLRRNVRLARGPDPFNLMIDKEIFPKQKEIESKYWSKFSFLSWFVNCS